MARDYLAIEGSSTSAERAFSSGSLTGTKLSNFLSAETFEALQLLKSACRNGHISASPLAAKHIDALIAELDEKFEYDAQADAEDEDSLVEDYFSLLFSLITPVFHLHIVRLWRGWMAEVWKRHV
jgi:hypothetical protein